MPRAAVRSLTLDHVNGLELGVQFALALGGNTGSNTIWEAKLQPGWKRPAPDSDQSERARFIEVVYAFVVILYYLLVGVLAMGIMLVCACFVVVHVVSCVMPLCLSVCLAFDNRPNTDAKLSPR